MFGENGLTINKGDRIVIKVGSVVNSGVVLTADNWSRGDTPDWYIEFESPKYGYCYWKQDQDGGHIVSLNDIWVLS